MANSAMTKNDRLDKQINFIIEMDKVKDVWRKSYILGGVRKENDAEHSWHLALMAMLLQEHTDSGIDILNVIKMVVIHDIVEIDAGDTYAYDKEMTVSKAKREYAAANRLFGLLPVDQEKLFTKIWNEYNEGMTAEAKFAKALDRLMPLLHNFFSKGKNWKEHGIKKDQVYNRIKMIEKSSNELWKFAKVLINTAVEKGYLME